MPLLLNLRRVLIALLLGSVLALGCQAQTVTANPGGSARVLRATLTNGLKVVIVRNNLAPVATRAANFRSWKPHVSTYLESDSMNQLKLVIALALIQAASAQTNERTTISSISRS